VDPKNQYWFRAKRYGWGWGLPCSWQGWAFFIPWLVALGVAARRLMPQHPFQFTIALALLTLLLVLVCYLKGEPLSAGPNAEP
jgi:CHASE2 domain-containing sensor protein